jgi:hypothetical protein
MTTPTVSKRYALDIVVPWTAFLLSFSFVTAVAIYA